uniref:Acyltransferase 3 domain-containing protein n=1 Tax=Ditylenchus dipsaci TaxID=166011 RepID=A0A915DJY4_9BILA
MSWIIFGHTYYYICTSLTTDNLVQTLHEFPKYFYNQFVVQAPLAVDSFFFLSGLLTSYIFWQVEKKSNSVDSYHYLDCLLFRRYLRLTPVYVVIMLLSVTLSLYVSEGPFWRAIDANLCKNSWMMRAWDGPVLLHKFKLGGVLIGILLLVLSSAYNLYITIVKPYIRCGPYIIGCLVAYVLLEKKQNPFKLSVTQWILGWGINSILASTPDWWAVLYTLAGRPAFAVCLGWITFACETNHGKTVNSVLGHKMFIPLSKLTFCAYLVHPLLLQLYYLSRPNAFHFTHSFQLLHMFFVAVFMSYAVALVFSLAFEMPVMHVDKLLFGGADGSKRRQQQPASSDGIIGQPTGQPNKRTAESNQEKKKTQQGLQPASNGSNEANEKLLKEYKPSLISEVDQ